VSETPPIGQTGNPRGQSVTSMGRNLINRFSVTENWTQTSTPLVLTIETVSKQPASTDRPLDQSPGERAMAPINAQSTHQKPRRESRDIMSASALPSRQLTMGRPPATLAD